jgi:biopolymer transport protein ExbB
VVIVHLDDGMGVMLMWEWFIKGGPVMYPLLLCSIVALGIILERLWSFPGLLRQGRAIAGAKLPAAEREKALSVLVKAMSKGLPVLEVIITVAPMFGFLGTVLGVIDTFELMGRGVTQLNKAGLSEGLAEALITTAAGLIIAIPSLVVYHLLGRCIDGFVDECNRRLVDEAGEKTC